MFSICSHPAQLEFPREAQVSASASQGHVPFSAFCSSRTSKPLVLQRGMHCTVLCPEHLFHRPHSRILVVFVIPVGGYGSL